MEHQKIINLLENAPNQPSRFMIHVARITPIAKLN